MEAALTGSKEIAFTVAGFVWALHDPVQAASFLPASMRDAAHFHHNPISAGLMAPGLSADDVSGSDGRRLVA